ncbi:MAG: 2-isopropylmalate synthase [Deltaproteobacteria bacterium]|nr:2-isopropylmalate synthase [Deltaproteobacteria bacterium]
MEKQKVFIFDTTLRDGEQSAGVSFTLNQKLKIAHQLQKLGVDIIEAGFPRTSPGDMEAVKQISKEVRDCTICALARCIKGDIEAAYEGIREAANPRIHTFINTSDIQIENQLKKTREEVLAQAVESIRLAKRFTSNVEFSPMDATRTDREFLFRIIEAAIKHGATTINVPDSVGYAIPSEHGRMFRDIIENVPNADKAVFSCHAHNDLGLASANALAAVENGARQVEVAVNGIGERAGNTAMEEVVMALKTREAQLGVSTTIHTKEIYRTSQLVERISGMPVQWNKAIVGKNSFRHGSGIHQDGIIKKRETWEIIDPAEIGIPNGTQLVLGKLSGSHAFAKHVAELGYQLTEDQMARAFEDFKKLADKKKQIDDRDIEAIIAQRTGDVFSPIWTVEHIHVASGTHAIATATIRLIHSDGEIRTDAATGDGPIDAICVAVNRIIGADPALTGYSVQNVTEGIDAQGTVVVRIKDEDDIIYSGQASDTDVIIASAKAYVTAVNRMLLMRLKKIKTS